jgi:ribosomal protein RSM22 (predicted rRNA methylase)
MSRHRACLVLSEAVPWRRVSSRSVFFSTDVSDTERTERTDESESYGVMAALGSLAPLVRQGGAVAPPAVVKTPAVLEKAVSDLQREMVHDHPKRFRQLGKSLVHSLKMKSLSKHRGGLQPNFFDAKRGPRPAFRGRERQEEKRALKELADLASYFPGDIESIQHVIRSHPSYDVLVRSAEEQRARAQARDLVPNKMYNGLGALAYATARLPSTYAAVQNVFQRLKISRGELGWAPQTMLDFGAGPGTAAWAARTVWPSAQIRVTNVEGSVSMAELGYQIACLVDGQLKEDATLDVRWLRGLPRDRIENKYDVCLASYSLNELRGPVERHQLLNRLMRSTKEYIVLIEHGTPHGFSIIEDSRRYVLKVSRKLGIPFHVAAPCPHDGPCPLKDKRAWCHFAQRHTRTVEQRVAVTSLTGKAPRDTYAERFSYVVLKRGFRDEKLPLLTSLGHDVDRTDMADNDELPGDGLEDAKRIQEILLQQVRNSRILRRRKRKGHVMLDLCSVLDADGALISDGSGTILRQTVSKGKSKSSWDRGGAYQASKSLSQGDEWPLVFQASRGHAIGSPIIQDATGAPSQDADDDPDYPMYDGLFEDVSDEEDGENGWGDDDIR